MSLEASVAHSWVELSQPSLTTPTLESVSFDEVAHQGVVA
jgi:hypothetical protein